MAIHELFAYLRVKNAAAAIAFYKEAFGATEKFRLVEPSGRIGHAELAFGSATLMISDEFPEYHCLAPDPNAKGTMVLHIHVDDCDAVIDAAVRAGARLVRVPEDHFYGERSGTIRDPFGYDWMVGHAIEQVAPEEMQRRYTAMLSNV
jgi:uncharacterized glyoxalase superfamily protein PhnB